MMEKLTRKEFLKLGGVAALAAPAVALGVAGVGASASADRMAILYDMSKCIGCRGCQVACKRWNKREGVSTTFSPSWTNPPDLSKNTWTIIQFKELSGKDPAKRYLDWVFSRRGCQHCGYPACAEVCPVGAITKYDEGPVVIDREKCIGCRYCLYVCPFTVPRIEGGKAYKCTMCYDRVQAGKKPACVETCPTGALQFDRRDELVGRAGGYVYGNTQLGGLSWIYASPVSFDKLELPEQFPVVGAELPTTVTTKELLKPVAGGLIVLTVLACGLSWLMTRGRKTEVK